MDAIHFVNIKFLICTNGVLNDFCVFIESFKKILRKLGLV